MRYGDVILTQQGRHESTYGQRVASMPLFNFYLSNGLVWVCKTEIPIWCARKP